MARTPKDAPAPEPLRLTTPRSAEGDPTPWANLAEDLWRPLGQYIQTNLGATLTPEQLRPMASAIVSFSTPYALFERQRAVEDLGTGHEVFLRVLRQVLRRMVDRRPCRIVTASDTPFCVVHGVDEPCPHRQTREWLATQPED